MLNYTIVYHNLCWKEISSLPGEFYVSNSWSFLLSVLPVDFNIVHVLISLCEVKQGDYFFFIFKLISWKKERISLIVFISNHLLAMIEFQFLQSTNWDGSKILGKYWKAYQECIKYKNDFKVWTTSNAELYQWSVPSATASSLIMKPYQKAWHASATTTGKRKVIGTCIFMRN